MSDSHPQVLLFRPQVLQSDCFPKECLSCGHKLWRDWNDCIYTIIWIIKVLPHISSSKRIHYFPTKKGFVLWVKGIQGSGIYH